jgi:hypothetical protein
MLDAGIIPGVCGTICYELLPFNCNTELAALPNVAFNVLIFEVSPSVASARSGLRSMAAFMTENA